MPASTGEVELTILMPCLNEAETIEVCIEKATAYLDRAGIDGEVLIADNGSTDGSQAMARALGARVVDIPVKGYGAALIGGIDAARGRYVIMGDADDSYDFSALDPFVERLRAGDDLVMGNRFKGGIAPGAMPPLHRYLGNPVLTGIGQVLFRTPIGDFHCGLRGFNRDAMRAVGLRTTGMEFASEMVVKSTLEGLRISEVPTTLKKDGRSRPPHLRSWRDGWRHLRFLMIYSPRWLFMIPGLTAFLVGAIGVLALSFGPIRLGATGFTSTTQIYLAALTVVGYQAVLFAILTKLYAQRRGFNIPRGRNFERLSQRISLESGAVVGVLLFLVGLGIALAQLIVWGSQGFGPLEPEATVRVAVLSSLVMMLGAQTVMGGLFVGVLSVGIQED